MSFARDDIVEVYGEHLGQVALQRYGAATCAADALNLCPYMNARLCAWPKLVCMSGID